VLTQVAATDFWDPFLWTQCSIFRFFFSCFWVI